MNLRIGMIVKEISIVFRTYFLGHLFNRTAYSRIGGELNKVAYIARPAAEICGFLVSGMICHIHCAEHMRKFNLVTVRQDELIKAAKLCGKCAVGFILLCNEVNERSVFRATERSPCA